MTKDEFTERWLSRQDERKKAEAEKRKQADKIHQAFKSAAINYSKGHYKRGFK